MALAPRRLRAKHRTRLNGRLVAFLDFGFSGGVAHGGQSEEAAEDEEESGFHADVSSSL